MLSGLFLLSAICFAQAKTDSLDRLASDFWMWRAKYRPFTDDDIPRMEHATGVRDWSAASIAKQRGDLAEFERRWKALRTNGWPVRQMVDYRLISSALARVRWELDVNPRWQRDPGFYVEQTVGALHDGLMPPAPFSEPRAREIVVRAENIPAILEQGKLNLKAIAPFAQLTIAMLSDIDARLARVQSGVSPLLTSADQRARFGSAISGASKALVAYRNWLKEKLPGMRQDFTLGDRAYGFFLHQVALLPYTPDQLLAMARQDFERVLAMESYERQRDLRAPELKIGATADEETARMAKDDVNIRRYLTEHQILTVPPDLPHWTIRPGARLHSGLGWLWRNGRFHRTVAPASGWSALDPAARERSALFLESIRARSSNNGRARRHPGTFFPIVVGLAKSRSHPPAILRFERQRRNRFLRRRDDAGRRTVRRQPAFA